MDSGNISGLAALAEIDSLIHALWRSSMWMWARILLRDISAQVYYSEMQGRERWRMQSVMGIPLFSRHASTQ